MKITAKKLGVLALGAAVALAAVGSGLGVKAAYRAGAEEFPALSPADMERILEADIPMEEIDGYLRENGYPEEFIEKTGEGTKRLLYDRKGVFESQTRAGYSLNAEIDPGFSASIYVSHISYAENVSEKQIVYNWEWNTESLGYERAVSSDIIGLNWSHNYIASRDATIFEIQGYGNRTNVTPTPDYHYPVPTICYASFIQKTGQDAITTATLGAGLGYQFSIPKDTYYYQYYGPYYATFQLNMKKYNGTYSTIIRKGGVTYDDYAGAVANYFRYTPHIDLNTKVQLNFGVPFSASITIEPKYVKDYTKSDDYMVDFNMIK